MAVFVSPPESVSVTVAPGTTAPLSSVTVPFRVALCACNEAAQHRISRSEAAGLTESTLLPSPQIVQWHPEVTLKARGAGFTGFASVGARTSRSAQAAAF